MRSRRGAACPESVIVDAVKIHEDGKQNEKAANLVDDPCTDVEIAASSSGEVKIYLSCNSAIRRSYFHMSSLDQAVQHGITINLQVFMTPEGRGCGLQTLQDLPKGAFVCEYVGKILTNEEFYKRASARANSEEAHAYLVLLDADWSCAEKRILKDEKALCLDYSRYGNISRFIYHRCFNPSLVGIPVKVETPNHTYYHLAFFTTREVKAFEELTWDYGIDFDDHEDQTIKAFKCECGSKYCRNIRRKRKEVGKLQN
ncbi:histone-lysine N-methyltransferase SUVR4-like isoform X2 [Impatiens glandulifera]|uniref:histone-lysine N-methyltransferase SUVR4-like isoform X2 n=1 Tax=Impatiens glandulifera TaxID=253017 RepID=UPI001FB0D5AD|nr:histone-lysine N-methyltransferase SUVR4-like isoform X2 [Impatiens glandulifera]